MWQWMQPFFSEQAPAKEMEASRPTLKNNTIVTAKTVRVDLLSMFIE
jgi:hypothetical protein